MASLHEIFSVLCGQQHTWIVGGRELPFCQRCTGLYVGVVPACFAYLIYKPKPTPGILWIHGIFLLIMLPFGYHLVAQTGAFRMLTGELFAVGLMYYLMLLPSDRWPNWPVWLPSRNALYFATGASFILLLQIGVVWGDRTTNTVLSWLGFSGLVLYGLLLLANLLLLFEAAWSLFRNRIELSPS